MKLHVAGLLCVTATACMPGIPIPVPMPGGPAPARGASEIRNSAAVTPRQGAGAIVVVRDKALRGYSCTHDISLDGQPMAGLRAGEQVTLYAEPGERSVGVSIRPGKSCQPAMTQVPVHVVASATTRLRIRADAAYDLRIESTTY